MPSKRHLTITALNKIFNKGIKPKEALDELSVDLDKRDRAFLMEIVYGVLRYRDYLDWVLKDFLKKPSGLFPNTLNNLRTAVYQLKYMRVPEWAVVDEKDLIGYKGNQLDMFRAVSRFLKTGGLMVYSVCSTEPEEGEEVIKKFLHGNPDFSIIRGDHDFLSPFEVLDKDGHLFYRTFPHRHDMDVFFAARLKKLE